MRTPPRRLSAALAALVGLVPLSIAVSATPASAAATDVRVNEIVTNSATSPDSIELTNIGDGPVDVSGWILKDNNDTRTLALPGGTTIAPGGFLAVAVDVTGGFGLGNGDAARVFLPDGTTLVDGHTFPSHSAPSWSRCADGTGDFVQANAETLGAANDCPGASDPNAVKLNEVESNGDAVGDWVEIVNTGDAPVDIAGWKVRDAATDHPFAVVPAGTVLAPGAFHWLHTEFPPPGFGLGVDDSVTLFQADGTTVVDTYAWSGGHAATTFGRCPDGSGDWRVTTVATKGAANACSPIRVNEIGPDWVELVNLSGGDIDVAGWVVKDSGEADATTLPAPSVVPAGAHLVVDDVAANLEAADAVRLLDPSAKLIDSFAWTAPAAQTYGRCKDGVGAFVDNVAPTPGAVNDCPGLETATWPGSQTVEVADLAGTFNQDASGLVFDPSDPSTLWVSQNKAGTLTKLVRDGATYVPAAGWAPGRNPRYSDGTGSPDSEGVTFGPDGAVYLASERNNEVSGVSKNTVLRYEPETSMNATDEWDLNAVLPVVGANLGLEGITWIPDGHLTDGGLLDSSTNEAYDPADYPGHGTGLYVVAVEGTGLLYVLALDQTAAVQETAHLVATIDPQLRTNAGPPGVMDVVWDPEGEQLWAVCDDSCDGVHVTLGLEDGDFRVTAAYDRPVGMPNLNNEGFALAPRSTCTDDKLAVLWADDGDTDGHSLRTGTFPCTEVPEPTPVVNVTAPRISGTPKVGRTLAGSAGTWTPTPATTTYQWLADGKAIAGATTTKLKVGPTLVGRRISLRVTVGADGFLPATRTSAATATVVRAAFAIRTGPWLSGSPRVGRVLVVQPGNVSPAPSRLAYAWYVNGRRIGASGPSLRVLRRWAGDRIAVKVTYTRPGYATATRNTAALRGLR